MKMTEDQIFSLIASEQLAPVELSSTELMRLYVSQVAAVSSKMSGPELAAMITMGAALYQKGGREFRAEINEKALFEALQRRRDEKGWR